MKKHLALLFALAVVPGCMDPTHDDQVKALGGEKPGVPEGPLHRPGQPCVTCHGGEGPGNAEFSLAGTVYLYSRQDVPAPAVTVLVEDIDGVAGTVTTNAAGSFWINASEWRPTYPLKIQINYGNVTKEMQTNIGRTGSCADCHETRAGTNSPGQVYVAINTTALTKAMQAQ